MIIRHNGMNKRYLLKLQFTKNCADRWILETQIAASAMSNSELWTTYREMRVLYMFKELIYKT